MKILLVTPAPPGSSKGNRVTAERWGDILESLGHGVTIAESANADAAIRAAPPDLLVALHAAKSAAAIERFQHLHPERPIVTVLTGTDLYGDIRRDPAMRRSMDACGWLVALQPRGIERLPLQQEESLRSKVRVIVQSATAPTEILDPLKDRFEICVSGHLRAVKDPFRTVEAVALLPASSRIRITHLGGAIDPEMATRARTEATENPRYTWLGEVPHEEALRILSRCRLLVLTSQMEGGANVVCEALALGVPVISSHIDGSIGLLGEDYPGYFPVGDTAALAELLTRAETDAVFYDELLKRCRHLKALVDPARERRAWEDLLQEINRPAAPTAEPVSK